MSALVSSVAWSQDEGEVPTYPEAPADPTMPPAEIEAPPPQDVDVDVTVEEAPEPVPVEVTVDEPAIEEERPRWQSGAVKASIGTGDFTEAGPQNVTGIGPGWDVRGVFGANSFVGLEAAYVGSARGVGGAGLEDASSLVSNGVEGDLRLAIPIRASDMVDVRPFAFGGIGWQYMSLWGDGSVDGASDDGDHIMTVPAGIGVEVGIGALNLDLRGTYRHAVGSEIFGAAGSGFDDPDALHSYNFSAGIGAEF